MPSDWPVAIDGRAYQRVPESWIRHGVDDERPDGPQLLAVSVAPCRGLLRVRYAHPRHDTVGAAYYPATDGDGGPVPDETEERWPRSIGASALNRSGVLRQPEEEHLEALWSERAAAILEVDPEFDRDHELVADGGSDGDFTRECDHCGATIDSRCPEEADHEPDCPIAGRYGGEPDAA